MTDNFAMTDAEKELFIADIKHICAEYFEGDRKYAVDVVTAEKGISVCIVFDAARVRSFKKPLR